MQNQNLGGENRLEKPCLVETSQGFSVSYKNRFLYSKYAPKRAIIQTIQNMTFLPNTLILCASPVLWYGLSELKEKLPENCVILGIETDENLYEFAKSELEKLNDNSIKLLPPSQIINIVEIVNGKKDIGLNLPKICEFRRAIMIEMSGGTAFDKDFYRQIANATENAIASFWKNRITLTKFGKLFSKNLFKNLSRLPTSINLEKLSGRITKPIIVIGAGEGTEKLIEKIDSKILEKSFILAVDASIPILKAKKIKIDGIVAVESQLAIEKAYIGNGAEDSIIFADISSRPQVLNHTKNEVCFFASEYADTLFFSDISKKAFFPKVVPPLGSVGLTATFVALLLRKDISVPIFVCGLDFSFSLGKTHANGAPANIQRLSSSNRFSPSENYEAAFRLGARKTVGKAEKTVFTDIALSGYAENFRGYFKGQKNLFDVGESGIDLGLDFFSLEELKGYLKKIVKNEFNFVLNKTFSKEIIDYLENEEKSLERMKELLTFGNDVARCGKSVNEELQELLQNREYLYLHFPDGYKCDVNNISQLKRIRAEIDFFLTIIKRGISVL